MKTVIFLLLTAMPYWSVLATAQDLSCESHKDGDVVIASCTGHGHKTVTRCSADGCSSSSGADTVELSPATLRKMCDEDIGDYCGTLAARVEGHHFNDAEEETLDKLVLGRAHLRSQTKFNEATLNLCTKGVFDKVYCDAFQQRMKDSGASTKASHPNTSASK